MLLQQRFCIYTRRLTANSQRKGNSAIWSGGFVEKHSLYVPQPESGETGKHLLRRRRITVRVL